MGALPAKSTESGRGPSRTAGGETWRLARGGTVHLRALCASDADGLRRFFNGLSDQSRYQRFFFSSPVLPDEVLIALLATDTTNHLGFVVVAGDGEEIIAHAQLVRTGPAEAEVALAVSDTWQGRGIGRRLLAFLQERGDALGLDALEAEYLSENRRIIAIFRDAHFTLHHTPGNGLIGSARMALRASEGFRAEPLSALAAPAAASSDDNLPWQRA